MKITFLGTGTSLGVPPIASDHPVAGSSNSKDKRLRCSILVETADTTIVVDIGPDFREQMIRTQNRRLDAVLLTHEHRDHTAGLDEVRSYNFRQKKAMDVWASKQVQDYLKRSFFYIFEENPYPGVPKVNLVDMPESKFEIGDIPIEPILVWHHKLPVYGFRFDQFTYITDANRIEEASLDKIRGTKILVLNALRKEAHLSHFNLEEAIDLAQEIGAEKTYFTHISHLLGFHDEVEKELPDNIHLAFDGLEIVP